MIKVPKERLDKLVSSMFALTRSESRTAIRRSRVGVDGKTVRIADTKVDPETQIITLDSRSSEYKKYVYIVMNKPRGVLSASRDKKAKTVIDLLSDEYKTRDMFCVGRLDKDTTGLLLITDDGDFCHRLMSPNKNVYKTYEVELDGKIDDDMIALFEKGVTLADATVCRPAKLSAIGENLAKISISEGKFHQVKRMFGVVGLGVVSLKRISVAGLSLPCDLKEGQYRELLPEEMEILGKS